MKTKLIYFITALLPACLGLATNHPYASISLNSPKVSFTENRGQVHDQEGHVRPDVLFGGSSGKMNFHLFRNGVSYQLEKINYSSATIHAKNRFVKKTLPKIESAKIHRVDIRWKNCNLNPSIEKIAQSSGDANFYNSGIVVENVKSYESIRYHEIYPGTDLLYYDKGGILKYDFIVSPGADYHKIRLQVNGAGKLQIGKNGTLLIYTELGIIEEGAPLVFENGKQLTAKWILKGTELSFDIAGHQPSNQMVIDPTTRIWGTYYGGSNDDIFLFCSAASNSDVYAVGASLSAGGTVIATAGAYQATLAGSADAIIAKFDASGQRLWATYYGGSGDEIISCSSMDASGNIFVAGYCDGMSGTALSSAGAFQVNAGGGPADVFIAKFSSSGTRLWGTYYGDSGDDETTGCFADNSGNIYVCGITDSPTSTLIASAGSHQSAYGGGTDDAFLVKFDNSGNRLWATYYGGTGDDWFSFCAADANGDIICSGSSDSNNGISTAGAQQVSNSGSYDAIVVKFNSSGVRQWGTYYGGGNDEYSFSCITDASGNIYACGDTDSQSGISTVGSHQASFAFGSGDAFILKLNSAGSRQWATYYGGSGYDDNYGCSVDANGTLYMSGTSTSAGGNNIATQLNFQSTFGGGTGADAYVVRFSSAGIREWGTYYGGNDDEFAYVSAAPNGDIYIAGYSATGTGTAVASANGHQPIAGGSADGFLAMLTGCTIPAAPAITSPTAALRICSNVSGTINAVASGTVVWYSAPTGGSIIAVGNSFTTGILTPGTYSVYAEAVECLNSAARNFLVYTVQPSPQLTINAVRPTVCAGENQTLTISGATSYSWGGGLGSGTSAVISPTIGTTPYMVIGTIGSCTAQATISQLVSACTGIKESSVNYQFLVYPNPGNGAFSVRSTEAGILTIYCSDGKIIYSQEIPEGTSALYLQLAPALYLVKFESDNESRYLKLVAD